MTRPAPSSPTQHHIDHINFIKSRMEIKKEEARLVESIYNKASGKTGDDGLDDENITGALSASTFDDLNLSSDELMSFSLSKQPSLIRRSCSSLTVQTGLNPSTAIGDKIPSMHFKSYHHATWYVSNAKQAASYFVCCLGFSYVAYKGLETGSHLSASHVVQNGNVIFEFLSPLMAAAEDPTDDEYVQSVHKFIHRHGDGVKDVAFEVDNVDYVYNFAVRSGAKEVHPPVTKADRFGRVRLATIEVFDDVHHTLVQKIDYRGPYLPGFEYHHCTKANESMRLLPPIKLSKIDHCVQNEDWNRLEEACDVYKKIFGFHEFWSVDENDVSTDYSALRSIVMASANEEVKMPMNEPAEGLCKSQIEEFLDFYNGPGVQHIAVLTDDIILTVRHMGMRGAEFITVPQAYYDNVLPRLLDTGVKIEENLNELKELNILIDFDEHGYLLQLFTKPLTDRPTFFLEVIQRHNHNGFGKGNFKALFETIEQAQRLRGTLEKNASTGISHKHMI